MTNKTEALRLADELEKCWPDPGLQLKAASELRRQFISKRSQQLSTKWKKLSEHTE